MNEDESHHFNRRFAPPREGLFAGEDVLWMRREGFGFWTICCGFSLFTAGPILLFFFEDIESDPSFFLTGILLYIAAFSIVIISGILTIQTRYYFTTARILVTRSGTILKEIPLSHFSGKTVSQFIESNVAFTQNGSPVYTIRIYDPTSDMTIKLKGIDSFSKGALERIGNIRECPYCYYDNHGLSTVCKHCGAVL